MGNNVNWCTVNANFSFKLLCVTGILSFWIESSDCRCNVDNMVQVIIYEISRRELGKLVRAVNPSPRI